jgi:hypothetical protein
MGLLDILGLGGVTGAVLGGPFGGSGMPMTHGGDQQYQLQMAQIGSQNLQAQYMFQMASMQINAQKDMAFEKFDTSLKMAKLDYLARMNESENQHKVDMRELDVREHEIELDHQQANSQSTSDFLT